MKESDMKTEISEQEFETLHSEQKDKHTKVYQCNTNYDINQPQNWLDATEEFYSKHNHSYRRIIYRLSKPTIGQRQNKPLEFHLIPMDKIRLEIKDISVAWHENATNWIGDKVKLASDIQNYADWYASHQTASLEERVKELEDCIKQQNEALKLAHETLSKYLI